jgi:hypothetical protein
VPALETRVERLEHALAQLRQANSPDRSWAQVVGLAGTSAKVARTCAPCRTELTDQLLAYGFQTIRTAGQAASCSVEELADGPVRLFCALLTYPPDKEPPEDLVPQLNALPFDPRAWREFSELDSGFRYQAMYRHWMYSEIVRFISPYPQARELRHRLHDPGFVPAALIVPPRSLGRWPEGLFTFLGYAFQEPSWWTILASTGQPLVPSFFDEPEQSEVDEPEQRPAPSNGDPFAVLWDLIYESAGLDSRQLKNQPHNEEAGG